jgi:hypothetical protein
VVAETLAADQLTRILYLVQGEVVVDDRRVALHAMSCVPLIVGLNLLGLFEVGDLLRPFHSNCGQQTVLFRGLDRATVTVWERYLVYE